MPFYALVLLSLAFRVVDGFLLWNDNLITCDCKNGGTCAFYPHCICPEGFDGWSCEHEKSRAIEATCDSIPCQNFGICTPRDWNRHECHCRFGFTGITCQTHFCDSHNHPCKSGSCERDGTPPNYYHCACPDSYTGEHCDTFNPTTTTETHLQTTTTTLPTSNPQTTTNPPPTSTIAQTPAVSESTTITRSTLSSTTPFTSPTATEGAGVSTTTTTTLTTPTSATTASVSESTQTTNPTFTSSIAMQSPTSLLTTTTLPPTTTSVMTSSASTLIPHMHTCFKYGIVHDIASSLVSSHPNASTCEATGTRKSAEAFVLNSCKIGEPSTWTKGLNVMVNCPQIPHYTPVFSIHGDQYNSSESVAAIFLECLNDPNGIKVAIQHCDTPPTIEHVTGSGDNTISDPSTFFTIQ